MQAVKDKVQCSRCGCIALPDATKCPKCGASYNDNGNGNGNGKRELTGAVGTAGYLPVAAMKEADTKVVRAYYQLTCSRHGKILVKATVIGSPIKCPFCE
jgi:hypothetical protein